MELEENRRGCREGTRDCIGLPAGHSAGARPRSREASVECGYRGPRESSRHHHAGREGSPSPLKDSLVNYQFRGSKRPSTSSLRAVGPPCAVCRPFLEEAIDALTKLQRFIRPLAACLRLPSRLGRRRIIRPLGGIAESNYRAGCLRGWPPGACLAAWLPAWRGVN